jgi:pyruvate,water dikinase
MALHLETLFGCPQDIEWTWRGSELVLLQARPITTACGAERDNDLRPWYLSLRRNLTALQSLRLQIESVHLPAMAAAADACTDCELDSMDDDSFADELERRISVHAHWQAVYWRDFIPFAHGMRLFGEFYTDVMQPADPYEFLDLLREEPLISLQRDELLRDIGRRLGAPAEDDSVTDSDLDSRLGHFLNQFGGAADGEMSGALDRDGVCRLARKLAGGRGRCRKKRAAERLEAAFLARCRGVMARRAAALLEVGRASYRLRDDDNHFLGRIEAAMLTASEAAIHRLEGRGFDRAGLSPDARLRALREPDYQPPAGKERKPQPSAFRLHARQLVGQPAGRGLATGRARVVETKRDMLAFQAGEVLVCDAIQPHMTVVVPLAAAIVERRGGMLIHGAIIAREYGLPCVTGVARATEHIRTGDQVTVDGFLGVVTNGKCQMLPEFECVS